MAETVTEQLETPVRRRHLGTMPGDNLLLPGGDLTTYTQIFWDFSQATSIDPRDLTAARLSTVPIPRFLDRTELQSSPAEIWANPIFWVPVSWRVNERGHCTDVMALRLVWELSLSGLYDPIEGFVDVLGLMGLDSDDPDDQARVSRWVSGADDALLDSFDITSHLSRPETGHDDWVLELSLGAVEDMLRACWGLNAAMMAEMIDGAVQEFSSTGDGVALSKALSPLALFGTFMFAGVIYDDVDASALLSEIHQVVSSTSSGRELMGCASVVKNLLVFVTESNAPAVEYLVGEASAELDGDATAETPGAGR